VVAIPHIVTCNQEYKPHFNPSLLYTGFVGKKKGLEYALELHKNLLNHDETLKFIVTGEALDSISKIFFEKLKKKYRQNVNYLGFVNDVELSTLLSQGHVLLLPTTDYKYICPASGNVVNAISKGSVVFTTRANANDEIISDEETGFFLTGDIEADIKNIFLVLSNESLRKKIVATAMRRLSKENGPENIRKLLQQYT
jgi:glycosyltransferase involved in cell wall biosynthesis